MPDAEAHVDGIRRGLEESFGCSFTIAMELVPSTAPDNGWKVTYYPEISIHPWIDAVTIYPDALVLYSDEEKSRHGTVLYHDGYRVYFSRNYVDVAFQLDPIIRLQLIIMFDPKPEPPKTGPEPRSHWALLNEEE